MGRGKEISSDVKQIVIMHSAKGKSIREIGELMNLKKSTVGDIVKRFTVGGRFDVLPRSGRPRIVTEHEKRRIVRKIKANPKLSAPKLTSEYCRETGKTVHPDTIRNVLKSEGYNGRVARRKPFVNKINRKKRIYWAREYVSKPTEYWDDVIFADESKFNVSTSDGRQMVWRKPNEELNPRNLHGTVKHGGGSVMTWGCMSTRGVGSLVCIEGTLTAARYIDEILRPHLRQSAEKMGILDSFKYYEDNDPKHKARDTQEWLLYNVPKILHPPPQSPDLNPIENLWDELDHRVHTTPVSNQKELRNRLQEEWSKISGETLRKYITNMPT